jgi:excisionase family DNA binding protein
MAFSSEIFDRKMIHGDDPRTGEIHSHPQLLPPTAAWRILRRRTGGHISRSTFYRWLDSGKVYSIRMGTRMYIPWQALQEVIGRCLSGEPF